MSRIPLPFYRKPRRLWYVQIGGKQINLGHDKTRAFKQYHQLMTNVGQAPKPVPKSWMTVPGRAGLDSEFIVLSWLRAAAGPAPAARRISRHRYSTFCLPSRDLAYDVPDSLSLNHGVRGNHHVGTWKTQR